MSKIFINLPVTNLPKATEFYVALGFTQNMDFSNTDASSMMWNEHIYVMLLSHNFCNNFLPQGRVVADSHKTCEVLNALQFDSRQAVDNFFNKAIAAGAKATIDTYDHGFMYGHDFEDLDGHIWEAFWMNISQMPKE